MKLNTKTEKIYTHEGAVACNVNPAEQLRRSVMSCMLWEDNFYEDGESIANRITALIPQVDPKDCVRIILEAKEKNHLRHTPLFMVRVMAKLDTHKRYVSRTLQRIITRPDDLTEFLAIYWQHKKEPLSKKVKQGLAFAFQRFDEYQLAKYDRDSKVKLRDVLFLCHSKPKDEAQKELYTKIVNRTLTTPDTWEVGLSGGADKKLTFERLIQENKLGALAFIRNLRNMDQASVDKELIKNYASTLKLNKILPFHFIAAAHHNPWAEPIIEPMFFKCIEEKPKFMGKTTVVIDVSGSMTNQLSGKSEMRCIDAACGVAMLARELCEDVRIFKFNENAAEVPARRGFALRDVIGHPGGGTDIGRAVSQVNDACDYDRIIVITDEQSRTPISYVKGKYAYIINVSTNTNGIGYGQLTHINGWSSSILDWMYEYEKAKDN